MNEPLMTGGASAVASGFDPVPIPSTAVANAVAVTVVDPPQQVSCLRKGSPTLPAIETYGGECAFCDCEEPENCLYAYFCFTCATAEVFSFQTYEPARINTSCVMTWCCLGLVNTAWGVFAAYALVGPSTTIAGAVASTEATLRATLYGSTTLWWCFGFLGRRALEEKIVREYNALQLPGIERLQPSCFTNALDAGCHLCCAPCSLQQELRAIKSFRQEATFVQLSQRGAPPTMTMERHM